MHIGEGGCFIGILQEFLQRSHTLLPNSSVTADGKLSDVAVMHINTGFVRDPEKGMGGCVFFDRRQWRLPDGDVPTIYNVNSCELVGILSPCSLERAIDLLVRQ